MEWGSLCIIVPVDGDAIHNRLRHPSGAWLPDYKPSRTTADCDIWSDVLGTCCIWPARALYVERHVLTSVAPFFFHITGLTKLGNGPETAFGQYLARYRLAGGEMTPWHRFALR